MNCGLCSHPLTIVLDMGEMALAGAFLRPSDFDTEQLYPLRFAVCEGCGTAQVADPVEPSLLFERYFYRSSQIGAVRKHFAGLARTLVDRFNPGSVLEIGCNDGALLRALEPRVPVVLGMDPNAPKGLPARREYFNTTTVAALPPFDLVVACNVFAHVRDLVDMTEAVRLTLSPGGVFVIEAHYLGSLLADTQYDAIYHEHVYYHSLTALETHLARFGLRVFDVERISMQGGSLRYYVDRGERSVSVRVNATRMAERAQGLDRIDTFRMFAERAQRHRQALHDLLNGLDGSIAGYGASGRANTLIQWAGIDLDYIVDDSPARQGTFTPGSHIPVCTPSVLEKAPPDYVLALAWTYLDDLKAKCRAPLVVPFPKPHVFEAPLASMPKGESPLRCGQVVEWRWE